MATATGKKAASTTASSAARRLTGTLRREERDTGAGSADRSERQHDLRQLEHEQMRQIAHRHVGDGDQPAFV